MRFLVACIAAPMITLALLLFMASLINNDLDQYKKNQDIPYFDVVMVKQDESFTANKRRKRTPPEVKPPTQEPVMEVLQASLPQPSAITPLDLSNLDPSSDMQAMAIALPRVALPGIATTQVPVDRQIGEIMAVPLHRVEPRYPRKALHLGKQGYVILSFDINQNGEVINIQVLDAQPKYLFEKESKRALKRWKYKPMLRDGKAVPQTGQKIRLDFKMES